MTGATPFGHHFFQAFRDCERRFYWRHVRRVEARVEDTKLTFGRTLHAVLAEWHKGGATPEATVYNTIKALGVQPPYDEDTVQLIVDLATIMDGYAKWVPKEILTFLEGKGERELTAELAPSVPYTGRPDYLVRDSGGGLWNLDFKSTTKKFQQLWKEYEQNWQMVGYTWLWRQAGLPVRGYIIRGIRKLKTPQFADQKFLVSPVMEREFVRQHALLAQRVLPLLSRPKDEYLQDFNQCVTIYGECPFRRLCLWPKREAAALAAYYREAV